MILFPLKRDNIIAARRRRRSGGLSLLTNRNVLPYSTSTTSNYVQHTRVMVTMGVAGRIKKVRIDNWGQNSASEFNGPDTLTAQVCIQYNNITYQSDSITVAAGSYGYCTVAGPYMPAGAQFHVVTRVQGSNTGSVARLVSVGTEPIFGEGTRNGTTAATNYTDGNFGWGATAGTPTISGGNITAIPVSYGGQNYTAGGSARAWQQNADGTIIQKVVGTTVRTGTQITSVSMGDGTPPSGYTWDASRLQIKLDDWFAGDTLGYSFTALLGTPAGSTKTVVLVGDSITIGWSSTDSIGDRYRNHGIFERGINNRVPVLNVASSGQKLTSFENTTTYAKTYALINAISPSNAIIAMGTNDATDGISEANIEARINNIANILRGYGCSVDVATILPRKAGISITGITKANPAVVTANNTFVGGELVYIDSTVGGMSQVRGLTFTVASPTATTFQLQGIDSTAYTTYTSGGKVTCYSDMSKTTDDTGFGTTGIVQNINTKIRNGTIISNNSYIDTDTIFRNSSAINHWKLDEGYLSNDLIHPNLTGMAWLAFNSQWLKMFRYLERASSYTLDGLSPSGAYSMRRLRAGYTGPLIRVRRASDSLERDLYSYSGSLLDNELNLFLASTTGYVTTIYDQSGNGYDATQATTASQPSVSIAALNSHSGMTFDGADDYLSANSLTAIIASNAQDYSFVTVASRTSTASAQDIFAFANSGSANPLINIGGTASATSRLVYRDTAGTIREPFVDTDDTSAHMLAGVASFNGTTFSGNIKRDNSGTQTDASGTMGAISVNTATIGAANSNGARARLWGGKIYEVIVFNDNLSSSDVTLLYTDQKAYWNLP